MSIDKSGRRVATRNRIFLLVGLFFFCLVYHRPRRRRLPHCAADASLIGIQLIITTPGCTHPQTSLVVSIKTSLARVRINICASSILTQMSSPTHFFVYDDSSAHRVCHSKYFSIVVSRRATSAYRCLREMQLIRRDTDYVSRDLNVF